MHAALTYQDQIAFFIRTDAGERQTIGTVDYREVMAFVGALQHATTMAYHDDRAVLEDGAIRQAEIQPAGGALLIDLLPGLAEISRAKHVPAQAVH